MNDSCMLARSASTATNVKVYIRRQSGLPTLGAFVGEIFQLDSHLAMRGTHSSIYTTNLDREEFVRIKMLQLRARIHTVVTWYTSDRAKAAAHHT